MPAIKRITVTESVWEELSYLKETGETFNQLLERMIEREKKAKLAEHLKKIADEGEFMEIDF